MSKLAERTLKYIIKVGKVLGELKITAGNSILVKGNLIGEVVDGAKRYFEDAKYYFEKGEYDVSLASISYCEGLLDALRMLGLVEFEW
ncbi:MAG: DUF357 domain-containing protein [Candidatus Bathyarchaeia archaeon]|nr:DUF357 domain-containing protein [Candidatus Bathyarchaeota archaeon]